ncbi:hypothetical protein [Dyadobacter sp. 3J3]|uniref:hypothetical protein n=1 Tax=Dyadobacter sp. 3J3 TaxID=2606600 RepID=UPI001356A7CA|nr:hypothetical protein [Dyadobacter sp. 3J3]
MIPIDIYGLVSDIKYLIYKFVGEQPETKVALGLAVLAFIILLAFLIPVKKEKV